MINIRLSLVIAGLFFVASSYAGLTKLDDEDLAEVSGQSGVVIDIAVEGEGINIEQITYTDVLTPQATYDYDTDGDNINDAASGGTLLLQNVTIKDIKNMRQTIKIDKDGQVAIDADPVDGMMISMGDVDSESSNNYSAVSLSNEDGSRQSELVDSLSLNLDLGQSAIRIYSNPSLDVLKSVGVAKPFEKANSSMLISIKSGVEIKSLDAQVLGFTQEAAQRKVRAENQLSSDTLLTDEQTKTVNRLANEGALSIKGLSFYGKDSTGMFAKGNKVKLSQLVWTGDSTIYLKSDELVGQMDIQSISAGNNTLGSLRVENIRLSPMINKVYAH